jgi:hypothetical protein
LKKIFKKKIEKNVIRNERDIKDINLFFKSCIKNNIEIWKIPVHKWDHNQLVAFTEWITNKEGGEKYEDILINLQIYGQDIDGKRINDFSKDSIINMKQFGEKIKYDNEIMIKCYVQEIDKFRNKEYPICIQWLFQKGRNDMNIDNESIMNPKLFVHEKDKLEFFHDNFIRKDEKILYERFEEKSFWIPIQYIKDGDRNYDFGIIKCSNHFATLGEKEEPDHLCWLYDNEYIEHHNNIPFVLHGYGNVDKTDNSQCGPVKTNGQTIGICGNICLTDCDTMCGDSGADIILRKKNNSAQVEIKNDALYVERTVVLGTHSGFNVWTNKLGKKEYWNYCTTMHDDLFRYVKSILCVSCPPRVKVKDIINYEKYFGNMNEASKRKGEFTCEEPKKKRRLLSHSTMNEIETSESMDMDIDIS